MSNKKGGISTFNRWLGIKNKDKSTTSNGKLSKSSMNLSISTTNINDTSQLEYNRIAPLPAVTSNAPFEQTFRITVLLPKDQLYVSRLGARVPLSKLLELVCENKLLDAQKYEFRNPVDPSQVYSCDLTIGAVGLSEIRLCHKTEPYTTFNSEEVMKLQRTPLIRDSLSSSEFSSHNSKHTTKTASPYSSSNSLNSMDSTGINYTRTPISPPPPTLPKTAQPKLMAPPRKKRTAPRPPSQTAIPEKSALIIENGNTEEMIEALKEHANTVVTTRKDQQHYASTPNLSSTTAIPDCNGNGNSNESQTTVLTNGNHTADNNMEENTITSGHALPNQERTNDIHDINVQQRNARNLYTGSVQNLSVASGENQLAAKLPEPSPRKRLIQIKKKSAPPAPPLRSKTTVSADDTISITSTTLSMSETSETPVSMSPIIADQTAAHISSTYLNSTEIEGSKDADSFLTRSAAQNTSTHESITEHAESDFQTTNNNKPKPSPRGTSTTLLNATTDDQQLMIDDATTQPTSITAHPQQINVSKVLLNRTPTPEPRLFANFEQGEALDCLTPIDRNEDDDCASKQADSGIGEPVPSPIPDSLPSEAEAKSTFESSSDDDDMVKTYNFKLGKTIVTSDEPARPPPTTLEEFNELQTSSAELTPAGSLNVSQTQTPLVTDVTSWNFSAPISPPPNFADNAAKNNAITAEPPTPLSDTPITPKIKERPILNFDAFTTNEGNSDVIADKVDHSYVHKSREQIERCPRTPLPSPCTPLNEIIDELSTILNTEKGVDHLIKKADEPQQIESAKPNTLSNFSITTLTSQQSIPKPAEILDCNREATNIPAESRSHEEENHYNKHSSPTGSNKVKSISRSDSFHATAYAVTQRKNSLKTETTEKSPIEGLSERSSSHLSLTKLEPTLNRRSSSELSIGESPSLQSLEVIKTILNARKASLTNEPISNTVENQKPKTPEIQEPEEKEQTQAKELPKVYRYSGPPSINFSTWSERPKVQVAIKNEGDYIFGGKNASAQNAAVTNADVEIRNTQTMPRSYRASMPVNGPPVASKPLTIATTIQRMGIPEKEFRVPITVKPLKDVIVDKDATKTVKLQNNKMQTSVIMINGVNSSVSNGYTETSASSTLPRSNSNRYSMPASSTNLTRATSITQLEANLQKSSNAAEQEKLAPFGQNTLRRTGLKEKILASEELIQKEHFYLCGNENRAKHTQENHQSTKVLSLNSPQKTANHWSTTIIPGQGSLKRTSRSGAAQITAGQQTTATNASTAPTPAATRNATAHQNAFKTKKSLQSTKLELTLQNPAQSGDDLRPSTNVTTPKSAPAAPPAPPPPAPQLRNFTTVRSKSCNTATTPTSVDCRDQLLEAIRNFKRDELKRT